MTPELIAIITVGVATIGLILGTTSRLRSDLSGLRDRVSRIAGLLEGLFMERPAVIPSTRGDSQPA